MLRSKWRKRLEHNTSYIIARPPLPTHISPPFPCRVLTSEVVKSLNDRSMHERDQVTHEEEAFALLEGLAEEKIRWRLKKEEEDRLKLARAIGDKEADAARLKALKAYGQWVPYADKMGKGIFYYNKV